LTKKNPVVVEEKCRHIEG